MGIFALWVSAIPKGMVFEPCAFCRKMVSRKRRGRKNILILSTPIESERLVPRLYFGIMAYRV